MEEVGLGKVYSVRDTGLMYQITKKYMMLNVQCQDYTNLPAMDS